MDNDLLLHRLHFAFTITYHYLFPQLTIGLGLLIVVFKTLYLRTSDAIYNEAARFWATIFGINFVFGVVTGIPMEFQFGTNWARFSQAAGGVIGQTLALEGLFSFFLESSFLGLFLFGEKRLGRIGHWFAAFAVFLGSWLSGYFIVATNAWMQHPVGYVLHADGTFQLNDFWAFVLNPWALWQYAHTISGASITGAFVVAAAGAFYLLNNQHVEHARVFVTMGVIAGCVFTILQLYPTGDQQGKNIARYQPVTLAAMEGHFKTGSAVPIVIIGQPNVQEQRLDNPIIVPGMLSFITHRRWDAEVKGLDHFPRDQWPDNIALLYYSYHIMVGLGTIFIAIMVSATWLLWRGTLFQSRWMLWILMVSFPLPYIANTAGWLTAELGRQPWLIYGLMRTRDGSSHLVSSGNSLFTLLGFMGLYTVLSMLFLLLMYRQLDRGPGAHISSSRPPQ
jgi:cytochrome d ubiquinol oxidase subunit I